MNDLIATFPNTRILQLDRLSRSLKDLLLILDKIEKAGGGFRSFTENVDSTMASGRTMMQMQMRPFFNP